ncbi:MAG: DUF2452 domain-containing protein [Nannocystaceae bacterium]|nr:DUF2452 domain-containing protein [Myxococcales bacterium]
MKDDALVRDGGDARRGPARLSPYPTSRLAPPHDLVDSARQIQQADATLGTVVNAKLQVIVEQIRALQQRAREIVDEAREHAALHRARCSFRKIPGRVYHLYRRDDERYFSLLSPDDWRGRPPHPYEGAYRLEVDMSWTPSGADGPEQFVDARDLVQEPGA